MSKINLACLIEDDPVHIYLSKRYLESSGYIDNIQIYNNGKEAYDGLKEDWESNKTLPEIILLDLTMPVWDGWKFLDEFIKLPIEKQITIYILTSSINEADKQRASNYNVVKNYLVKPITMQTLVELIERMED